MNINLIYRHPCELEIESLLSREERAQVWFM